MKLFIIVIMLAGYLGVGQAYASGSGDCDHYWQTAKDGSSCGDRAADRREGGR